MSLDDRKEMCGEGRRSEGSREKLWVLEDPRNGLVERDEEAMDHSYNTERNRVRETERERQRWLVNGGLYE